MEVVNLERTGFCRLQSQCGKVGTRLHLLSEPIHPNLPVLFLQGIQLKGLPFSAVRLTAWLIVLAGPIELSNQFRLGNGS